MSPAELLTLRHEVQVERESAIWNMIGLCARHGRQPIDAMLAMPVPLLHRLFQAIVTVIERENAEMDR